MEPQGISAGYMQGQDKLSILRQRALQIQQGEQQLAAAKQDLQAQAAAMSGLGGGPQPQPGSMPMQPSQQMPPRPGTLTQQPPMQPQGGQPPMQMAPQAAPQPRPGMAPPAPGGGQPQQPQQPPTGQPGGQGGYGSGVQNVQDPQTIIQGIAQRIKAANPGMDGATLFQATTKVIGLMKGVDSETKNALNAELKILQIQSQADTAIRKAQSAAEVATIRAESQSAMASLRMDIARMYEGGRESRFERKEADLQGGLIDKDTLKQMASQAIGGDKSVFQNLGRGAQGAQNIVALRKEISDQLKAQGLTGKDLAIRNQEFMGLGAAERTTSVRGANIDMAIREAESFAPLALAASEKVKRTQYPTLNSLIIAADKGTGDENVVQFAAATQSFINAYARATTPTGAPTEGRQERAQSLLSTSYSKGQFRAGIAQLQKEMAAAQKAPGQVQEDLRKRYSGSAGAGGGTEGADSAGIAVGEVHDGYRFKGGDARDKASWEKVAE